MSQRIKRDIKHLCRCLLYMTSVRLRSGAKTSSGVTDCSGPLKRRSRPNAKGSGCPGEDAGQETSSQTSDFFGRALSSRPVKRVYSACGRQFFLYKYQNRILEFGVRCKVDYPGTPHPDRLVEKSQRSGFDLLRVTLNLARGDLEDAA